LERVGKGERESQRRRVVKERGLYCRVRGRPNHAWPRSGSLTFIRRKPAGCDLFERHQNQTHYTITHVFFVQLHSDLQKNKKKNKSSSGRKRAESRSFCSILLPRFVVVWGGGGGGEEKFLSAAGSGESLLPRREPPPSQKHAAFYSKQTEMLHLGSPLESRQTASDEKPANTPH